MHIVYIIAIKVVVQNKVLEITYKVCEQTVLELVKQA